MYHVTVIVQCTEYVYVDCRCNFIGHVPMKIADGGKASLSQYNLSFLKIQIQTNWLALLFMKQVRDQKC